MNSAKDVPALFKKAVEHHVHGRLAEALTLYDIIIRLNPNVVGAHCNRSFVLHSLKRFDDAVQSCNRAIALKPDLAEAYNIRGIALKDLHRLDEAVHSYDRAIALKPDFVEAYNNKGIALEGLNRPQEALQTYDQAIKHKPDFAEAFYNRGRPLQQLRRPDEALRSCDRAVELRPDLADAYIGRGNALRDLERPHEALESFDHALKLNAGSALAHTNRATALMDLHRHDEALQSCDRAIVLKRDFAEAYNNKGIVLEGLNRMREALRHYDHAIRLKPDFARAHYNRANALQQFKHFDEALKSCDRAIELVPDFADGYIGRGNALRGLRRSNEAIESYDQALRFNPESALAHNNRASTLIDLHRFEDAIRGFNQAIALKPDFREALFNKGVFSLLMGNFEEGWPLYEWRSKKSGPVGPQTFRQPVWSGHEDLEGKTLLVHAEQGLGDTIQFCRYAILPELKRANVILAVQGRLMRLLRDIGSAIRIVDMDTPPDDFDYHIPLLSMPFALRTNQNNCPAVVPYLRAESDRVAKWRSNIGPEEFKIGICWQGAGGNEIDVGRSFPVRNFEGISKISNVRLLSLQKNLGVEQLLDLPVGMKVETLGDDFDSGRDAFIDTAAVIENLDLIITSDTAIAHLAGALGRPTWIVLKDVPDWRWMLERSDSPWYPTVRLFRQARRDDWSSVFTAMEAQLVEMVRQVRLEKAHRTPDE